MNKIFKNCGNNVIENINIGEIFIHYYSVIIINFYNCILKKQHNPQITTTSFERNCYRRLLLSTLLHVTNQSHNLLNVFYSDCK